MAGKRYSREFKDEAVKLVESGTNVRQAASELGISEHTLRDWVKRSRPKKNAEHDRRELTEAEELRQLRSENKRLRVEREISKKATAYFAKDQS